MKAYPNYKDSGVPWLGEVPEHWEMLKLRIILTPNTERNRPELPLLSVVREKGVIKRNIKDKKENYNVIPENLDNYKVVCSGQFVINKMKAWQGSYGLSAVEGLVSPAYFVFDINRVGGKFFHLAMRSKSYVPFFTQASDGVRTGQWDLNRTRLKEIPFFVPPLLEQQQIARYLDWQTAKINKFINAKKKLIALLKEQKQIIINEAVTKGLNPDVEMKDSGVEWLGDIPAHWEVRKLKNIAKVKVSGVDKLSNKNEIPVQLCNYTDAYKNEEIDEKIKFMKATATEEEIRGFELLSGDVLITKDSENWEDIAVPAFVPNSLSKTLCAYHLSLIRPNNKCIEGKFLAYSFIASPISYQFKIMATGVTRFGISLYSIKNSFFIQPPSIEQKQIVNYLKKETALIDKTITRTEREIELIQEYRTRLVSDVVTGKVDVRSVAVPDFEAVEEEIDTQDDAVSEDELIMEDSEE